MNSILHIYAIFKLKPLSYWLAIEVHRIIGIHKICQGLVSYLIEHIIHKI